MMMSNEQRLAFDDDVNADDGDVVTADETDDDEGIL